MTENQQDIQREMEGRSTSELVSILRNRDEEEWRPEVFQIVAIILASRGISPGEIAALGPEGVDVVETQQLVTVGRYPTPLEAHSHRLALEAAGLTAWVCDEAAGTMYGMGVGARLQVRVEDEEAARAVLEDQPSPSAEMPPECGDPPCPRCGSTDVTETAEAAEPLPLPQVSRPRNSLRHECRACGHSWLD
jgi:hypothetical protein